MARRRTHSLPEHARAHRAGQDLLRQDEARRKRVRLVVELQQGVGRRNRGSLCVFRTVPPMSLCCSSQQTGTERQAWSEIGENAPRGRTR